MKTRRQRETQKEEEPKRVVALKLKVHKFISPISVYHISNNVYLSESQMQDSLSKLVPMESLFSLNKIVRGRIEGDYIIFTTIPLYNGSMHSEEYMCERFLSFGKQVYKDIATRMQELKALRRQLKQNEICFTSPEEVISKLDTSTPTILISSKQNLDETRELPTQTEIFMSFSYAKRNGWNSPEDCLINSIQAGRIVFPFLVVMNEQSFILESMSDTMALQISVMKSSLQRSHASDGQSSENTQNQEHELKRVTSRMNNWYPNKHVSTPFEVVVPSPFLYGYRVLDERPVQLPFASAGLNGSDLVDLKEEYDLLEHLVPVAKNKLQRFQSKICGFRCIDTTKMEEGVTSSSER